MSDFNYLKTNLNNATMEISINRPEVYNALNGDAKMELVQAIRMAGRDEQVKTIILTAEGRAFCSGQDLNDRSVQGIGSERVDLGHTLETEWNPLINSIKNSKKLVIGAINGVSAGAGLSIALACDIIVARPGAKFISGFSGLGLAPDAGASFTFVKAMGYQRTLEFFLFNQPLTSENLMEVGMINKVEVDFLGVAREMAQKINKMAPLSLELIKKNLQAAQEMGFKESMDNETVTQRFLGASDDYQEGLKSFFDKRSPEFKGS